jgi:hypothetical protein
MLVKPMNSTALIQQLEALLVAHEDRKRPVEKIPGMIDSPDKNGRKESTRSATVRT